ncbi:Conserved hypothetical protein [Streptococcus sanguinis SK36]|uniref:Uncharacterized protein n=1 Tax=Streptococcus sanguinis (strain SK36) TaxID=388919 RepID=A3CNH4_STRSV|nr:hypothetical protein [Streptococcus sanguinis]ABN44729.1 Conserved hypothetical protein [Streptococcus sanguinis SK36]MBZ2055609.1 hypothetical protein [Streptococcus sanguinis]
MSKEFLVYQNKVYSNFVNYINDYILLSEDPEMLKEGYFPYSSYVDGEGEGLYGKLVPYSEVSQRYSVYDRVLYKGQEFAMAGHKRGDDDFTAPDSYVRILVSDKEFLNENNIADGAELMDDKYGLITYASGKIPVSEVTILRRRKDLPVDRRRKI